MAEKGATSLIVEPAQRNPRSFRHSYVLVSGADEIEVLGNQGEEKNVERPLIDDGGSPSMLATNVEQNNLLMVRARER